MVWAIVVAAGAGTRFGAQKQFLDLNGRSVAAQSVAACRNVANHVVLVVPSDRLDDLPNDLVADVVVAGGSSRSASVRAGLEAVPLDVDIVVIHDAARPMAPPQLFHDVVAAVRDGAAGSICAISVTDTIKVVDRTTTPVKVLETLNRDELVAVQTPQAFDAVILRSAHEGNAEASDDAALVEILGHNVVVVNGSVKNVKITTIEDLAHLEGAS
ncbi:MAG: 2-C-methyl-D-erythritol 4-phosphate cytidylyltransferase [Actinomycetota bacterium]